MQYDRGKNAAVLRWQANPRGRKPVAYRVYASDEKGFSVSDEPFEVSAGIYDFRNKDSTKAPTRFPAKFVAETKATELTVIGPDAPRSGAKAFYRVVAVDEHGNQSGPSDYAAMTRPVIYSTPVAEAKVGGDYRYDVQVVRSLGDLRTRIVEGREVMNYWDAERPRFHIERGPEWLTIDETTGQLSGKPDSLGTTKIIVVAELEQVRRRLDPAQLQWGVEKIVDEANESVGTAKQTFAIETKP